MMEISFRNPTNLVINAFAYFVSSRLLVPNLCYAKQRISYGPSDGSWGKGLWSSRNFLSHPVFS
jgi:hypothetical protein